MLKCFSQRGRRFAPAPLGIFAFGWLADKFKFHYFNKQIKQKQTNKQTHNPSCFVKSRVLSKL